MNVKIFNSRTGRDLANEARLAKNFFSRAVGLMGKKTIKKGEGLVLPKCNSVHSFFMNFNIDLVFVNENQVVITIIENLPKWRISPFIKDSAKAIELPTGTIKESGTMIGDLLIFEPRTI